MARENAGALVLASPFKFGFFAGLGFFFASAMMSVMSVLVVAVVGIGTLGSLLIGSSGPHWHATSSETTTMAEPSDPAVHATPAAAVLTPRPTYHQKTRTAGNQ